jgi:hypothetical protein
MTGRVLSPHQYVYSIPSGWRCPICDVPIRNQDCPVNREAEGRTHSPDDDCPKTHLRSLVDGEPIVIHEPGRDDAGDWNMHRLDAGHQEFPHDE